MTILQGGLILPLMKSPPRPKLKSNIPALIRKKGWTDSVFDGHVQINGRSADTAKRARRGETNFSAETLAVFVRIFELTSIADVVDVVMD